MVYRANPSSTFVTYDEDYSRDTIINRAAVCNSCDIASVIRGQDEEPEDGGGGEAGIPEGEAGIPDEGGD